MRSHIPCAKASSPCFYAQCGARYVDSITKMGFQAVLVLNRSGIGSAKRKDTGRDRSARRFKSAVEKGWAARGTASFILPSASASASAKYLRMKFSVVESTNATSHFYGENEVLEADKDDEEEEGAAATAVCCCC